MCTSAKIQASRPSLLRLARTYANEVVRCAMLSVHALYDFFVRFVLSLYYDREDRSKRRVPVVKNDLLLDSAVNLARKIREGKLTSHEVVQSFITRAQEVNPLINAIVEERFALALEEAKKVDETIGRTKDREVLAREKPFLGVPFTTKESNRAEGMLHTMGSLPRKTYISPTDATCIFWAKQSGAILIAKTNVPELNLWCESRNLLYGETSNPYDFSRTVGGSSGGEGAIVASCGSAMSVASDIGGSTRMPAFFCGVFGFKPTEGLTPLMGIGLREEDHPDSMAQAGPICKRAEDLSPFLRVLIGPCASLLRLDSCVEPRELRVFYQESSGDLRMSPVGAGPKAALRRAVKHFEGLGCHAMKLRVPGTEHTSILWKYWMTQENFDFKYAITGGKYRTSISNEVGRLLTGRSEITGAAILKILDEDLLPKVDADWARDRTKSMKEYLVTKLAEDGVFLYPSAPYAAQHHHFAYFNPYNFGYWSLANVLRLPCCQIPMGLDDDGLPLGVQVIAGPYQDHLCIAVAEELERAFGGWVAPS